jgi:hypothetical protein
MTMFSFHSGAALESQRLLFSPFIHHMARSGSLLIEEVRSPDVAR